MAKKLIIAALSARGYAQAAKDCGYEVITLDAFADADAQQVAAQTFKIKMNAQGVDAADFKRVFCSINLDEVAGFLYGSLFDNCPDLLAWVADKIRLVGNSPQVMQAAKSFDFFKLLDQLKIQYPEIRPNDEILKNGENWLAKQLGGTGGTHVKSAKSANSGDYFQRKIDGKSISMLFVADGNTAHLIGFNEQLLAPTAEFPYRFAGAVGGIALPLNIHAAFEHIAQQLTSALNLRGINSLDAILAGETLWVLELNPRLSATFHLYENLFSLHIQACAGDLKRFSMQKNISKAQLILYADKAIEIVAGFAWPSWVADIPAVDAIKFNVKIEKNAPICTVLAQAQTAELAHGLVLQRADKLREMLMK